MQDPPQEGFENIFNILNPMDLVPQVMPGDWGYGRYGRDMFLPVTEFTSFLGNASVARRADEARERFGLETVYSPALNLRTRLLISMIIDVVGDRDTYNARLQPMLVSIMQNKKLPMPCLRFASSCRP